MKPKFNQFKTRSFWFILAVNLACFLVIVHTTDVGPGIVYVLGMLFTYSFIYPLGETEGLEKGERKADEKWRKYVQDGRATSDDIPNIAFVHAHVGYPREQHDFLRARYLAMETGAVFTGMDGKKRRSIPVQEATHYAKPTGHVAEIDRVLNQADGIKKPSRHKQRRNKNKPKSNDNTGN